MPRSVIAHALVGLALVNLLGCSDDTGPGPQPGPGLEVRFELGEGGPRYLDLPFPSDAYLDADGSIADEIPGFRDYVRSNASFIEATLGKQRGFGLNTGATFRVFDNAELDDLGNPAAPVVDPSSLPASEAECLADGASVALIDLDAASPAEARVPCRARFHDDRPAGSTQIPVLAVNPARGVVLTEGHRYAAVVTERVTAGGAPVRASATFAAIRDGTRSGPVEELYGAAYDRARELVPALDETPVSALTVFTTQETSEELVHMRRLVADAGPARLSWDPADVAPMRAALFARTALPGYTATLDEWLGTPDKLEDGTDDPARDQPGGAAHGAIAAIGTAVFDAPNFLRDLGAYEEAEHANVARDAKGLPRIDPDKPTSKIWATFALPTAPMPPDGFPVVVIQHGLQGDRSFLLDLADTFAKEGWASVAIEAPTFGARSAEANFTEDSVSKFTWSEGAGYAGPDGFVDQAATAAAFFGGFTNFGAVRDQLRASAIDIGALAEVLSDPALDLGPLLDAVPGAKLDASRMAYVGDSFGSIVGLMVASVEPRIGSFVLNVGGGGVLTEIVAYGPAVASIVTSAAGLLYGFQGDRFDETHPLLNLLQSMVDPADPLTHAHRIVRRPAQVGGAPNAPKNVILIEALWDELVSNEGSEAVARAAGFPLAAPHAGTNAGVDLAVAAPVGGVIRDVPEKGATAVLVQASPATHGSDFYSRFGKRHYAVPFGQPGDTPFPVLDDDIPVAQPYLGLQRMAVRFFASAFAGEVPVVTDIPKPVRDFDDDGRADDGDDDPLDPTK